MAKIVAIIQARMGSTRLPGKVLMDIKGKTVLGHVIERLRQSAFIDEIVIATTVSESDDRIVEEVEKLGVSCFRGSEEDVLSRYYHAANNSNADIVVRITSDCPLIDPKVTDEIIRYYLEHDYDIATNAGADMSKRTYPRGLDTEVFSFGQLTEAFNAAKASHQREHVTPYIYENSGNIGHYLNEKDYSEHRWTLDTTEDFEMISKVYHALYRGKHDFYMEDIIEFIDNHPEVKEINDHIEQKKL